MPSLAERVLACDADALFGLPGLIVYAHDPSETDAVVERIAERLDGSGFAPADSRQQQQQQWTPRGSVCIDCAAAGDDAVLTAARGIARQSRIERSRRLVVLRGAGALARHVQHALRKVVEESASSALFVMTARCVSELDAALLSRALVLNCTNFVSKPASALPQPAAAGVLELACAVSGVLAARGRRASRDRGAGVRDLVAAARAAAAAGAFPGALRSAIEAAAAADADAKTLHALVEAAAAADHAHACMRRSRDGGECAVRALAAALQQRPT